MDIEAASTARTDDTTDGKSVSPSRFVTTFDSWYYIGEKGYSQFYKAAFDTLGLVHKLQANVLMYDGHVESGRQEYRVSDQVQIHLTQADLWLEGAEGLERILADGYTLTLYYDRSADQGGQVRIITAK